MLAARAAPQEAADGADAADGAAEAAAEEPRPSRAEEPSRGRRGGRCRGRAAEATSRAAEAAAGNRASAGPGRGSRPGRREPAGRAAARLSTGQSVLHRIREHPLVELIVIVALAIGLALRHPGGAGQALPDPERVDGADARRRPARAREPRQLQGRATPTGATSSSSTRRRAPTNNTLRSPARRRPALPAARRRARTSVNFIKRIVAMPGRHALGAQRARGRQRQAPGRAGHQALRTRNLQFPGSHQDSAWITFL